MASESKKCPSLVWVKGHFGAHWYKRCDADLKEGQLSCVTHRCKAADCPNAVVLNKLYCTVHQCTFGDPRCKRPARVDEDGLIWHCGNHVDSEH
jgi:hypothetical protein